MSTNENQKMNENFYIEKEKREFQEAKERHDLEHQKMSINDLSGINENASGDNRSELNQEERHHQEKHGNRKYKAFTNHDSSHDQPTTNTGPGTV